MREGYKPTERSFNLKGYPAFTAPSQISGLLKGIPAKRLAEMRELLLTKGARVLIQDHGLGPHTEGSRPLRDSRSGYGGV